MVPMFYLLPQTVPENSLKPLRMMELPVGKFLDLYFTSILKVVVGLLVVLEQYGFLITLILFILLLVAPSNATTTLPIFAYNLGWGTKLLGRASAVTVLLFVFSYWQYVSFYFGVIGKWEKGG